MLVHVQLDEPQQVDIVEEFRMLADSAGAEILGVSVFRRHSFESKYFIGAGQAEEIRDLVAAKEAEVVIFNHALSPAQERNLEKLFQCRVLDRTTLILDIFAQRARSHEGKLQVELAQLRHLSTRLIRGWTHLERQKGGIGLRGPGETQLESDRRMIATRIKQITKKLEKVDATRALGRRARKRSEIPTVSLVGYTNAGKSTLFNKLTDAQIYAANQLFATLDPTLRKVQFPGGGEMILADTVGFIRNLPHDLVKAFRSTLQETQEADLLLHVVDVSHEDRLDQIEQVNQVLAEIGADEVPQILVYNKIDHTETLPPKLSEDAETGRTEVWLSAQVGTGIDLLLDHLRARFYGRQIRGQLMLKADEGKLRALLHQEGGIVSEAFTEDGEWQLQVELPRKTLDHLRLLERVEA